MLRRLLLPKHNRSRLSPFEPQAEKRLRIVIDRDSIRDERSLSVLLEFAGHPLIEIYSTSESDGVPYLKSDEASSPPENVGVHRFVSGKWVGSSVVAIRSDQLLRLADKTNPSEAERLGVRRSFFFAGYALESGTDAYVTECPALLGTALPTLLRSNPVTPKDTLALLGLFLRVNSDFTLFRRLNPPFVRFNPFAVDRSLFYWGLARALLPSGWRWFSACVQSSRTPDDDEVSSLAGAVLSRIDRTLRARDRMWEQCQRLPNNDTSDEMLFYLDQILFSLVGAFDALARVANLVHQPEGRQGRPFEQHKVKWNDEWITALGRKNSALGAALQKGAEPRDVIDLIAPLRNMIHGEGLSAFLLVGGQHASNMVMVPLQEKARLLEAANRRGGLAKWGLTDEGSSKLLLEPEIYVEAMMPAATRALDHLMRLTRVENLPGVDIARIMQGPPADQVVFTPVGQERLLLLGGLA